MLDYLLSASLRGLAVGAVVVLVLGLVALIRCDTKDIPTIVQAIASWWHK